MEKDTTPWKEKTRSTVWCKRTWVHNPTYGKYNTNETTNAVSLCNILNNGYSSQICWRRPPS